jgi:ORF6N domain-containing protein
MRSQFVTASKRNIRYRPYAFTEQGVAMLSSVLRSSRAVEVNEPPPAIPSKEMGFHTITRPKTIKSRGTRHKVVVS